MVMAANGLTGLCPGGSGGIAADVDVQRGEGTYDRLETGLLIALEKLDALDAGELIGHGLGNIGLLNEHRQDALAPLGGKGQFLDDVLRCSRVFGDGEDEYLAVADGGNNLLAPHGGALDAHLVDPHGDSGAAQPLNEVQNAVAVL